MSLPDFFFPSLIFCIDDQLIATLRRSVAAAEASNDRLLQDIRDRDAKLQANASELRERDALRARYSALSEELEKTKAELAETHSALTEARAAQKAASGVKDSKEEHHHHNNKNEKERASAAAAAQEAKLAKQREELAEVRVRVSFFASAIHDFRKARSELAAREQQIQQLHLENAKFGEGLATLTRENHSLRREVEELSCLLEQTRTECSELRSKCEELQLHATANDEAAPLGPSLEDSLREVLFALSSDTREQTA